MKRATLSAYPSSLPAQPTDLTDRLLAGEDADSAAPPVKRRRGQSRAGRASRTTQPAARPPEKPVLPQTPNEHPASLAAALAAADLAAEALNQAGREAPARYDVALRYRLDALAHHLQQVKEFVNSLATR